MTTLPGSHTKSEVKVKSYFGQTGILYFNEKMTKKTVTQHVFAIDFKQMHHTYDRSNIPISYKTKGRQ